MTCKSQCINKTKFPTITAIMYSNNTKDLLKKYLHPTLMQMFSNIYAKNHFINSNVTSKLISFLQTAVFLTLSKEYCTKYNQAIGYYIIIWKNTVQQSRGVHYI